MWIILNFTMIFTCRNVPAWKRYFWPYIVVNLRTKSKYSYRIISKTAIAKNSRSKKRFFNVQDPNTNFEKNTQRFLSKIFLETFRHCSGRARGLMTFLISKNSRQITGHYSLINATSELGAPQFNVHATTTWGHGGCSTGCGLAFSMKMHNPHAWIGAWTTPWKVETCSSPQDSLSKIAIRFSDA